MGAFYPVILLENSSPSIVFRLSEIQRLSGMAK